MQLKNITSSIKSFFNFGSEGSWRGPVYGKDPFDNWHQLGRLEDGFQRNLSLPRGSAGATAFACQTLLASLTASLPFMVIEQAGDGSRLTNTSSDAARALARPNGFQTSYELFEMLTLSLLRTGNAFLLKIYNERGGVAQLFPVDHRSISVHTTFDDGGAPAIFYAYSGGFFKDKIDYLIPARDVLHIRINADPSEPLRGRAPLEHAAAALGLHEVVTTGLMVWHTNTSRVGALLTSDSNLTPQQIQQLKAAWAESSAGWGRGKTVVLPGGLKAVDVSNQGANAADQRLLEILHASDKTVTQVYGVPPELVGLENAQGRSAAEASRWLLATSLGPLLEVIEQSLTRALGLDGVTSWIEADTSRLLRTDEAAKWSAIETSVRAGVRTINEARRAEGLPPVSGADQPLVQQQDLPLGMAAEFAAASIDRMRQESARNNPKMVDQETVREQMADRLRSIKRVA